MTVKEIVDVCSALLTPLIAVIATYIAYQQYHVSELTLKKELYERRIKIYGVFESYFNEIMQGGGQIQPHRVAQFYSEAIESEFLFNSQVVNKVNELCEKGIKLSHLYNRLCPFNGSQGVVQPEERSLISKEHTELLRWFHQQEKETRTLLKDQISIQKQRF